MYLTIQNEITIVRMIGEGKKIHQIAKHFEVKCHIISNMVKKLRADNKCVNNPNLVFVYAKKELI